MKNLRISFKENYFSSDILIGLNSKIPAEIRKNSDLSVYKRLVVDRIVFDDYYERSLRLPNGKSGIFAMNHEFLYKVELVLYHEVLHDG